MKLTNAALLAVLFVSASIRGQISGNQAYGQAGGYNERSMARQGSSLQVTESELTIQASVLMNVRPDALVVTLGVSEEAKTVKDCSEGINKRIEAFRQKAGQAGIKDSDVYVDFISQTRIYDYELNELNATQLDAGFEIKKNIIVRLKDAATFDRLTVLAAGFGIFDIVKAEYIVENTDEIYNRLLDEALKAVEKKKERYATAFKPDLSGERRMLEENSYRVEPKTQYREYKAFETADLSIYNNRASAPYIKKEQRKNKTFYYQGTDTTGFDKIINASDPQVGMQYAYTIKVSYHIKK